MTRRHITVLGSVLVGLFVAVHTPAVSAADVNGGGSAPVVVSGGTSCIGFAPEHCEAKQAADEAVVLRTTEVAAPVHRLGATGIGQEHFEATWAPGAMS